MQKLLLNLLFMQELVQFEKVSFDKELIGRFKPQIEFIFPKRYE